MPGYSCCCNPTFTGCEFCIENTTPNTLMQASFQNVSRNGDNCAIENRESQDECTKFLDSTFILKRTGSFSCRWEYEFSTSNDPCFGTANDVNSLTRIEFEIQNGGVLFPLENHCFDNDDVKPFEARFISYELRILNQTQGRVPGGYIWSFQTDGRRADFRDGGPVELNCISKFPISFNCNDTVCFDSYRVGGVTYPASQPDGGDCITPVCNWFTTVINISLI